MFQPGSLQDWWIYSPSTRNISCWSLTIAVTATFFTGNWLTLLSISENCPQPQGTVKPPHKVQPVANDWLILGYKSQPPFSIWFNSEPAWAPELPVGIWLRHRLELCCGPASPSAHSCLPSPRSTSIQLSACSYLQLCQETQSGRDWGLSSHRSLLEHVLAVKFGAHSLTYLGLHFFKH